MAHRDFDAARREAVAEPLTFTLGGEDFAVPLPLPALPVLDLAAAADAEDVGAFAAFGQFIFAILPTADHQRFRATRPGLSELLEIVQWLITEATGRPTGPPSGLPVRRSPTGTPSNGGSSVPLEVVSPT